MSVPVQFTLDTSNNDNSNLNGDYASKELSVLMKKQEILECNQRLLDAIANSDYETYDALCSDDMTCIEPESNKQVVYGKAFHKYYFDFFGKNEQEGTTVIENTKKSNKSKDENQQSVKKSSPSPSSSLPLPPTQVTMVRPLVQLLGPDQNVAVVTYIRLNQNGTTTTQTSETRVWERVIENDADSGTRKKILFGWKNCHFHKS